MFFRFSLVKKNSCKLLGCCCGFDAQFPDDCIESILEVKKQNCLRRACCFANVLVCGDGECEKVCGFVGEASEGVGLESVLCVTYELLSKKAVDSFC